MAVTYKASMTKAELLEIAVTNGVEADDGMTKAAIIAAIDAHNDAEREAEAAALPDDSAPNGNSDTADAENPVEGAQGGAESAEASGGETTPPGGEHAAEGAQGGAEGAEASGGETTQPSGERAAEGAQEAPEGYDVFVYAGPTLPRGRLKENAIFRGTFKDVAAYLADVLEEYPQVAKLIVPANRLGAFAVKVKTPGNIAHKHYTDIVSAMRGNKEV